MVKIFLSASAKMAATVYEREICVAESDFCFLSAQQLST